jgi:trehalose synthase
MRNRLAELGALAPSSPKEPAVLERVPLLEKELAQYAEVAGADAIERIRAGADPLQGARVLHISATAYGGGVAELLATHVPLLRNAGIDAEWQVMRGSDEFFTVTKAVHNALQGGDVEWTHEMQRIYLERVLDNALLIEGDYDFIVVHDPQPAALLGFLQETGRLTNVDTHWVWRCHLDLTAADPTVWEFFRPYIEMYDASVWTMAEFVPESLSMHRVVHAPPCIDPLSVKNLDLARPFCEEITKQYGVDLRRPIVCQVSRFDPWKDPVGVIAAFRIIKERVTDAQLVLAGSMATDDPEGFHVWELTETARDGDSDIHLLSNIQQVGSVQINAFQRVADVVIQKSLREGFGLTVSEALWKSRPVVGGRAGGIALQLRDGYDGFLVNSIEECAARTIDLLADPVGADAMGMQGREHVRDNFLSTREMEDWLRLFSELRK